MVFPGVAASELVRLTTYFERLAAKIDGVGFTSPAAVGSRILILLSETTTKALAECTI
jgi:hypothetical protein